MKNQFKLAALSLTVSILVPAFTYAQVDFDAQIQSLLSQVTNLQVQLDHLRNVIPDASLSESGSGVDASVIPPSDQVFVRNLSYGMRGVDVQELQNLLITQGFLHADPTGFYGNATASAVGKLQASLGLESPGVFGPLTRSIMQARYELVAAAASRGGTTPTPSPAPAPTPAPTPTPAPAPQPSPTAPRSSGSRGGGGGSTQSSLGWHYQSTNYVTGSTGYYNSFFINGSTMTMYNNHGTVYASGKLSRGVGNLSKISSWQTVIAKGPEYELQWLRAPALAKGSDGKYWLLVEATRCYIGVTPGCSSAPVHKTIAYSSVDGITWEYKGPTKLNGGDMPTWQGSMALVYQPEKPGVVDNNDYTNNRFIYYINKSIAVSADGINFTGHPFTWPIAGDAPVFASLAKTPYGWHLIAGDKWDANVGVAHVRHLFSKDLKNWKVLEMDNPAKSPAGYKSVNIYYEASTNRLWAYGHSGSGTGGGYLSWIEAKSF